MENYRISIFITEISQDQIYSMNEIYIKREYYYEEYSWRRRQRKNVNNYVYLYI